MEAEIHHIKAIPNTPVYASHTEVLEAVKSLTGNERVRLMLVAKYWWRHFYLQDSEVGPEDLLQEALLRVLKLEKARRWPKHITFFLFLKNVMKSIASHHLEQLVKDSDKEDCPALNDDLEATFEPQFDNVICGSEARFRAVQELTSLQIYFGDDAIAFRAMMMGAEGYGNNEILEELNVDKKEWETIRKRIQRKLIKYLQENTEGS
jgi:DNA-directed RNA polymerase specialized sigma24 family protein